MRLDKNNLCSLACKFLLILSVSAFITFNSQPFLNKNNAYAGQATATFDIINILRAGIGLIMGYNTTSDYISLVCGSTYDPATQSCDGPPLKGLVGTMADIVNKLPAAAALAGIPSCSDIPSSGSQKVSTPFGVLALKFETPTHNVPDPWIGGSVRFSKRVVFKLPVVGTDGKFAAEFNCGTNAAIYVAVNMPVGQNAPNYTRLITLYNGYLSGTQQAIETYMSEYNPTTLVSRASDAIRIEFNSTTNNFHLWGIFSLPLDQTGMQMMSRASITGNFDTGVASLFYSGISLLPQDNFNSINGSNIPSSLGNASNLTDGSGGTPTSDLATNIDTNSTTDQEQFLRQGCINFSNPLSPPSNGTSTCPGYNLVSAENLVPYIDASGAFSMNWALDTMPTKMEIIQ